MLKTLLKSLREYKKPSIITVFLMVGEVIIECLIPFITGNLVNKIQNGEIGRENSAASLGFLLSTGGLLVLMAIISLACGGMAAFTASKGAAGFAKNLRHDIFYKVQGYSFENIDKFSSASLVTRMTTDITNVQMSYMMIIRIAVRAPLMMIFAIIMAYITNGTLATSFVVIIPILVAGLILIAKFAMPAFRRVFKKYDLLNESIEENVRAMRVVNGFSKEEYEKEKFGKAAENIRVDFTKAERIVALNAPLMQICIYFNMAFVLLVGSKLVITSGGKVIGVGQMTTMLTYGMQVLIQLMMFAMLYVMITMSAESAKRITEVLNEESSIKNCDNPIKDIKDGSIDFEDVSFKYSKTAKEFALSNINLHIESGATVGVIGGTGSSKTTLIQLIPRLYDVTEGSVKVGGIDVKNYDIEALRDNVSVVLQKNLLFSGTIKDNLRWGNEKATDEEIRKACALAKADEFIENKEIFPDGYDTMIEQGGTNVSGGQKQRLCIARALLKNPKILILDDSTSAVDTKTDAYIRDGFRKYIPKTTKIIIAQRIASVMDCDLIVVMDNGKISDMGTHDSLLESSNIYREVYQQQQNGNGGDSDEK